MLISFNRRGGATDSRKSSGGKAVRDYLLGKDNDREYARVLKGEPEVTTEVINGLNFAKIYTSGVLAFDYGEGDKLSDKEKLEIIESFEMALFPNLEVNQYTGYWVEHTDKVLLDEKTSKPILDNEGKEQRRLEMNFVFASVELTSGKALPVYYHKNDINLIDSWRDVTNATYNLADPNDPKRRRALSIVSDLPKKVSEIREDIHDFIVSEIEQGHITNRYEVLRALDSLGLIVARETKTSISVKNPDGRNNIRFKGEIYEREFKVEELSRTHSSSKRTESCQNSIDITTARARYAKCVKKRCFNLGRRFETRDDQREQLQKFSGAKPSPFNFSSFKIAHNSNSDPIPRRNNFANKRINVSTMETVGAVSVDNNNFISADDSINSLEDAQKNRLDTAVLSFIKVFTDEYTGVRSDWSGNGSPGTLVHNETKAKFNGRQLNKLKEIKELNSYSDEQEVREVLGKAENELIVALLIDPITERKRYQLSSENDKTTVTSREIETSSSNKSTKKPPVSELKYPKYTP